MSSTPRLEAFMDYMCERHRIYLLRRKGHPGPWTNDPILGGGRFCNVFRELDTVTQWVNEHIRIPYAEHPNLWLMLAIARYINWPPTLAWAFETDSMPTHSNWEPEFLTNALSYRAEKGEKVYTGAYMIRAESDPKAIWYSWSKHAYIAKIVIGRLWEDKYRWKKVLENATRLETVWKTFQEPRYVGWGPFMAYEVVTDLRHTHYLRDAIDIYTWANAGPGAIRGLNRLFGRPLEAKPRPEQTNEEMHSLMIDLNDVYTYKIDSELRRTFFEQDFDMFEMRDVEHTLCEFDKYERVRLGEGKMRSKYDWRTATPL